jgi:iron complex outermembrane receptor protein
VKNIKLFSVLGLASLVSIFITPSVWANQSQLSKLAPLNNASVLAKQYAEVAAIQVTGVRTNQTVMGLKVILETTEGDKLQVLPKSDGNIYIADMPNAQLRLLSGNTFSQENPAKGITLVTVSNADANSIRLTITGEKKLPRIELFDGDEGLIFGAIGDR